MEYKSCQNSLSKSKTIIFGTTGLIGSYLYNYYKKIDSKTYGFSRKNKDLYFDLEKMDFPSSSFLQKTKASYGLIPAGISKINVCENFKEKTYKTNVTGTLALVELLIKNNITPIWFSSDYVFDGINGNYNENSPTNPTTEYGRQKATLEKEIPKITNGNHLIIRPGKVYSSNLEDNTIYSEIVNSLKQKKQYRAAVDQIFSSTYIDDLVIGISKLQDLRATGIFHICSSKNLSRYEVVSLIANECNLDQSLITPIHLDELTPTFIRPKNTSIKSDKFLKLTNYNVRNLDSVLSLLKITE